MIALLADLWPGLAVALVLGLATGALAGWPRDGAIPLGLGLVALLLAGLATSGLVQGAPGLWLDGGATMLALYVAGCALGGLGGRRRSGPGGT